jgi:hypothetical protein
MMGKDLEDIRAERYEGLLRASAERRDLATLFIQQVSRAMADGVKHYSVKGVRLTTVLEVSDAMLEDGEIRLQEPNT